MRIRLLQRRSKIRNLSAITLLTLLVIAFFTLLVGGNALKTQIDRLAVASSDNLGWNISQVDVDYKSFMSNLLEPMTPGSEAGVEISDAEFSKIQLRFDIFYSRVSVIGATLARVGTPYAESEDFTFVIQKRDKLAGIIDNLSAPTTADIDELYRVAKIAEPHIRNLTTRGIQSLAQAQSDIRAEQYNTFTRFYASSFIILGFVLLSSLLAFRLWRDLEERSRNIEAASTNVRNAFEAAQSAVILTDTDGTIIQCNDAATKYFGMAQENILGLDFVHGLLDSKSTNDFLLYQKSPGTDTVRLIARCADYKEFPIEMSGVWTKDVEGHDTYIIYLTNISERLAAEEKLKASRDEAKEASETKSRFLATMSHEMRTPLHGLIASLDMIEAENLTPPDQKLFHTALECSNRALEHVTSILDHTRLAQVQEVAQPFVIRTVLEKIQAGLSPLAAANGNTLTMTFLGEGTEYSYNGLPEAFSRVMYNLIGNAIKFTENGQVSVDMISTKGSRSNTRYLNFVVSDQGIGIADEDKARIFESFEKAKFNEEDSTLGSGLGLSIVKHAIEQMNSEIHMTSQLGKGSTFKFTLELEIAKENKNSQAPEAKTVESEADVAPPLDGAVLIVDDNKINRTVLHKMVSRLGYESDCVELGSEAVAAAEKKKYALILMDINMPSIDGHEATRIIRSGNGESRDSTILGVTALISSDRDSPTDSGMDAMLPKPLTADRLKQAINRHLGTTPNPQEADDIEQYLDPAIAKQLKAQSLTDAQAALDVLNDPSSSWEDRRNSAHYAVGSTGIVGFNQLSSVLSIAEEAAKQTDQATIDECVSELSHMLSK
ncbi:ATP-binding protein [Planktotalea sp.]|uniref:PAS domain-containing hybrid sensor histidine kinase/response regulator n=1 Tax=Planktotalea sp. TaxID=2029877 RepID=UPI0035C7DC82